MTISTCFNVASEYSLEEGGDSFLTGAVDEQEMRTDSQPLKSHLDTAKKIIQYTQKTIRFSTNHPRRSGVEDLEKLESIDAIGRWVRSEGTTAKKVAELAEKYQVGKCAEMALVGFLHAQSAGSAQNIEVFSIDPGDHVFLVIGRTPSLFRSSSDYKKWNPEAVICDPWSGSYYPSSMLEKHLKNFIDLFEINGVFHTQVRNFDREHAQLLRVCSNLNDIDRILYH